MVETKEENYANSEDGRLLVLIELLKEEKYEDILDNKEKYSRLFVDKEQVASKEQPKMLIKSK